MSKLDSAPSSAPAVLDYAAPRIDHDRRVKTNALLCAGSAYLIWGVVGWYFKILTRDHGVLPFTLLAHRVVWSLVFVVVLLTVRRELPQMLAAFCSRRLLIGLTITSILVAINWITFIYAAGNGKLKEASLGYFLTPIMNVILGVVVLRESMRTAQAIAVGLAAIGVGAMVFDHANDVWIPLSLMVSWSFYALLRKQFVVNPIVGLGIETAVLLPLALAYIVYLQIQKPVTFATSTYSLLMAAGVITAVPLILFAMGARHLQMITIGLLQYIGPTVQFLIAVLILNETVTRVEMTSFIFIWIGLIVFSIDSYRAFRARSLLATLRE
jgi:chloramphenicol-sensitive protein RarD